MEYKQHPKYSMYKVSDSGKVMNHNTGNYPKKVYSNGYAHCTIQTEKGVTNSWRFIPIHVLVAETWIPNPDGLPVVNHKDEVRDNNRVDNLEWVSYVHNTRLAVGRRLHSYEASSGNYVKSYISASQTREDGFNPELVLRVANGKQNQTGGFMFKDKKFDKVTAVSTTGSRKVTEEEIEFQIQKMGEYGGVIKINDIASELGVTRQTISNNITKRLKERIGYLNKTR